MMVSDMVPVFLGFLGSLGPGEIALIAIAVFLLFGAKKLPEIMKSFAQGIREFKRESNRIVSDIETAIESDPEPPAPKTTSRTND